MADSLLFQNKPDVDMPAVLVEGAHVPDALAGAYLASVKNCPVISMAGPYPNDL